MGILGVISALFYFFSFAYADSITTSTSSGSYGFSFTIDDNDIGVDHDFNFLATITNTGQSDFKISQIAYGIFLPGADPTNPTPINPMWSFKTSTADTTNFFSVTGTLGDNYLAPNAVGSFYIAFSGTPTIPLDDRFSIWNSSAPLTFNGATGQVLAGFSNSLFLAANWASTPPSNPVPEPATILLLTTGLGALSLAGLKKFIK
jgi:hypothetical protein